MLLFSGVSSTLEEIFPMPERGTAALLVRAEIDTEGREEVASVEYRKLDSLRTQDLAPIRDRKAAPHTPMWSQCMLGWSGNVNRTSSSSINMTYRCVWSSDTPAPLILSASCPVTPVPTVKPPVHPRNPRLTTPSRVYVGPSLPQIISGWILAWVALNEEPNPNPVSRKYLFLLRSVQTPEVNGPQL